MVSIVIPVYNGSNFLAEAIDSALAQTYKDIEVLVVNDGSDDNGQTEAIAKSYGDNVRYFYKENGGVASALNLAIKESAGEYISWLSHDDLYLPNKIESQIQFLGKASNKKQVLFSDYKMIDVTTGLTSTCRAAHHETDKVYRVLLLLFGSKLHGCTMLIPKDVFKEVGLFNEQLRTTQDYELWIKLVKEGYEFTHVKDVLVETRWHDEQGTFLMSDIHRREVEDLYNWAAGFLSNEFRSFSFKQIEALLTILSDKHLRKAKDSILRSWCERNPVRYMLSFVFRIVRGVRILRRFLIQIKIINAGELKSY